jgi:hypothetical protein
VEPWLQVFFEGKLRVTSAHSKMTMQTYNSNAMIIEEGGSYEDGPNNPAL